MSISGRVIQYIGWGSQFPNPEEVQFQMEILYLVGFDVFQEHIPGVKRDLPVIGEYQAGFRSAKATMDQIFTVKNLLERA